VAAIVERFRPEQVVLYGSRAHGVPRPESDVDLMVVMDAPGRRIDQMMAVGDVARDAMSPPPPWVSVDVKVRTPAQIRHALAERDFFIEDVMLKGIRLFGGEAHAPVDGEQEESRAGLRRATMGWVQTAEMDRRSAAVLLAVPDPPLESVCFHGQQCAEKYLKAMLQERLVPFPRTHDLDELAKLAASTLPSLGAMRSALKPLNAYAVGVRYPDLVEVGVDRDDAEEALRLAEEVRGLVRAALGLDEASD
jgi:HEPN domain-containing protein/predicted nucleotidyltransferase